MKPDRNYLTRDEMDSLLVRDSSPTDRLLIQLGLSLGCRVSEIVSLKVRNIRGRIMKIFDVKKNMYRECVIDSDTEALLKDYLENHYTIPRGHRREIQRLFYFSERTANRKVQKAFQEVGITKDIIRPRWHVLRHSYIKHVLSEMKDRGLQIAVAQTGDTPETILRHYGIPSLDERLEVADEFSIIRGSRSPGTEG